MSPKPAATALLQMWGSEWSTRLAAKGATRLGARGTYRLRGFYGKYRYSFTADDGKRYSGMVRLPAAAGPTQAVTARLGDGPAPGVCSV